MEDMTRQERTTYTLTEKGSRQTDTQTDRQTEAHLRESWATIKVTTVRAKQHGGNADGNFYAAFS